MVTYQPAAQTRSSFYSFPRSALMITHSFFALETTHSSRFGAPSRGSMPSALKGRAAKARGKAPGLCRTKTRCKPQRGAMSVFVARRPARPVGALRPLARFRVPGALPLAVTAPHLRCYSTRAPRPRGRGAAGDTFPRGARGAWERGVMIQTRRVTFVENPP